MSNIVLKGFMLRRTGNLIQVRNKSLGTLYQSHSIDDIKSWLRTHAGSLLTDDLEYKEIDQHVCPVRYGRTTTRP